MLTSLRPVEQLAMLFEEQMCPYLMFLLTFDSVLYNFTLFYYIFFTHFSEVFLFAVNFL